MKKIITFLVILFLSITLNPQSVIENKKIAEKNFINSIGMEFVLIPAGEFLMGCSNKDHDCNDDEKPQHKVKITKDFYMGKHEVTQEQWKIIMGDNPSYFKNCGSNCPVEQVSWDDVQDFINNINSKTNEKYRLPTEAEWEYASRGSTNSAGSVQATLTDWTTKYYWGNKIDDNYLWYSRNSGGKTHPVGMKIPNKFGLYDMLGNVMEWVEDLKNDVYYIKSPTNDPKEILIGDNRGHRGGAWSGGVRYSQCSDRFDNPPGHRFRSIGFRLVMTN